MTRMQQLARRGRRLWAADRPLTAFGFAMAAAAAVTAVGLALDPRIVTGAPVWLKPWKFAVSTAVYSLTLAWVFSYLREWPRLRRIVGRTTAGVLTLEIVLIFTQAARGTTSHFNVATPFDAVVFSAMGIGILVQTITSAAVVVALWRQRFEDEALGRALRLGMAMTIVGAMSGGLMTRPTAAQIAEARATGRLAVSGAHTVGAPDGGPGVPGTTWSRTHGDLRVPHFLGLHALQVLAVLSLAMRRRLSESARLRVVGVSAAAYAALFVILLWQALRGESIVAPQAATASALIVWTVATAASLRGAATEGRSLRQRTAVVG